MASVVSLISAQDGKPYWNYRFVPFPGKMDRLNIYHHVFDVKGDLSSTDSTFHCDPFDTVPLVTVHIPPPFAIVNTGSKLVHHPSEEDLDSLYDQHHGAGCLLGVVRRHPFGCSARSYFRTAGAE